MRIGMSSRMSSSSPMDSRGRSRRVAVVLAVVVCCAGGVWAGAFDCGVSSQVSPVELSGRTATKLLILQPKPQYPPAAQLNYIRGKVRLRVTVDCRGRVVRIHVLSGHPFLAQAAMGAVWRWLYRPFHRGPGAVPFQTTVEVHFDFRAAPSSRFPPRPDQDLLRMVSPPRLVRSGPRTAAGDAPHLRLLVSSAGRVIDSTLISGSSAQYKQASVVVANWKFIPAKCDNLNVPWYVDMAVPLPPAIKKTGGATPPEHACHPWTQLGRVDVTM
jgi:TonB family protein